MTDSQKFTHGACYPKLDGLFHGYGTRLYVSGAIYRGMFKQGRAHGKGVYVSKAMRYEGEFQNGRKHGDGSCYFFPENPLSCTVFTCPAGFCHRVIRDDDEIADTPVSTVSGSIRMLERIFRYDPTTTCIYRGEWRDDLFHGRGTYYCCDGRKYEGQYVRGKRQGFGTQSLVPKSQKGDPKRLYCGGMSGLYRPYIYTGQWNSNKPSGHGKTQYAPGYQHVDGIHDEMLNIHGIAKVEWPSKEKTRRARYRNGWRVTWIGDDVDLNSENRLIWSRTILKNQSTHRRRSIGERRRRLSAEETKAEEDVEVTSLPPGFDNDDQEFELSLPPGFGSPGAQIEDSPAVEMSLDLDTKLITDQKDWILSEPAGIGFVNTSESFVERPPGF